MIICEYSGKQIICDKSNLKVSGILPSRLVLIFILRGKKIKLTIFFYITNGPTQKIIMVITPSFKKHLFFFTIPSSALIIWARSELPSHRSKVQHIPLAWEVASTDLWQHNHCWNATCIQSFPFKKLIQFKKLIYHNQYLGEASSGW